MSCWRLVVLPSLRSLLTWDIKALLLSMTILFSDFQRRTPTNAECTLMSKYLSSIEHCYHSPRKQTFRVCLALTGIKALFPGKKTRPSLTSGSLVYNFIYPYVHGFFFLKMIVAKKIATSTDLLLCSLNLVHFHSFLLFIVLSKELNILTLLHLPKNRSFACMWKYRLWVVETGKLKQQVLQQIGREGYLCRNMLKFLRRYTYRSSSTALCIFIYAPNLQYLTLLWFLCDVAKVAN